MAKGVAEKGYKMTQNRKNILNLLIEEGGALRSKEGKSTSLMHGLLEHGGSLVSLNATLRELESLGFIEREIDGRRTYGISITDKACEALGVDHPKDAPKLTVVPPKAEELAPNGDAATNGSSDGKQWDWDTTPTVPDGIDYDMLLAVFLKAALRGMEGPSNGQYEQVMKRNAVLEAENVQLREENAAVVAERNQLETNLNLLMTRAEEKKNKSARGTHPIRDLVSPQELASLEQLMRQIPTRRGD